MSERRTSVAPSPLGVVLRLARAGMAPGGQLDSIDAELAAELGSIGGTAARFADLTALTGRCLDAGEASSDDVTLAWELARSVEDARVEPLAFALCLLVLDAAARGSTRLVALARGVRSRDGLEERAAALGIDRGTGAALGALLGALATHGVLRREDAARPAGGRARTGAGDAAGAREGGAAGEMDRLQLELPFSSEGDHPRRRWSELRALVSERGSAERVTPLVADGESVALARWAEVESRIAEALRERAAAARSAVAGLSVGEASRALVEGLRAEPIVGPRGAVVLTDEQEEAVVAVLSERTVVLTGGPGTGKTSVVVAMLRALARRAGSPGAGELLSQVALAAPTGKAADRLGESVRSALSFGAGSIDAALAAGFRPPTTLHRLLGYRPSDGSFRAHRHNRLAQRLVIVDEASMIDAALFERLVSAVDSDATLVLLGDPDQLPSVDPGAVLRDLVRARPAGVRVVELTQSHRMDPRDPDGAHVLSVARACLVGGDEARAHGAHGAPRAYGFREPTGGAASSEPVVGRGGAWALEASSLLEALDAWIVRHVLVEDVLGPLESVSSEALPAGEAPEVVSRALEHLGRARLLSVTRRTADELDAYVTAAVARWRSEPARRRSAGRGSGRILPGEPVMAVRNDYDEDLWNGDSGVAWRSARGELRVSFRRGASVLTRPLSAVAHVVERAHAVTVHKAQGSEHDEVMLVLPPGDTPLLTREIVYTAITRARRSAIVVGRSELLATAIQRRGERDTGLGALLSPR